MRRVNIANPEFEYDAGDPPGFRAGMLRFGPALGASQLGASVYELPPGQAICPYHYEYAEEEWLLVLEGNPTVRHPDGSERLEPWDAVCFPTGPEGAHGVRNETDQTVRVLMFSTVKHPAVTVYPDSDKIGVWTPGKQDDLMAPRSSGVDYFFGETGSD
ncbi:MAG TPA: cupin domain-containing protein [Solirubrobacterales bacterium]|nr:cupin domain-containing protein [Solirubrobacterales bacterium]